MIVAMAVVDVMQATIHQVVDVVAVGNGLVAAVRTMDMIGRMATALTMSAVIGIDGTDLQHMLIHVIAMHMVQMAIVEIVDMAVMLDSGVAAVRTVLMAVIHVMLFAGGHDTDSEKGRCLMAPRH
jgi:hypothetical protein